MVHQTGMKAISNGLRNFPNCIENEVQDEDWFVIVHQMSIIRLR